MRCPVHQPHLPITDIRTLVSAPVESIRITKTSTIRVTCSLEKYIPTTHLRITNAIVRPASTLLSARISLETQVGRTLNLLYFHVKLIKCAGVP